MKHLRLLKFNRKQHQGKVSVDLVQVMNDMWFDKNIEMLNEAAGKVAIALNYEKRELNWSIA